MDKIKIISDSTCDLTAELIKKNDIEIIPLYVNFGEESYLDGETLTVNEMYDKITNCGYLPKTAAIAPGTFTTRFKYYLDQGYKILYMGIGSKFSATLQSANLAKKILQSDDIHLVDSKNLSSGTGLLVLKACKFRDQGDDIVTIEQKIIDLVPKVRTQFVINTMEYLYKGGRCNSVVAFVGTILKIKPIIKVVNGEMAVGKKGHGKITSGLDILIDEVQRVKDQLDDDYLMVTHSLASDSVKYINDKIDNIAVKNKYVTSAGCVISSHCGQGCIGILYIMK
ncbi:MAG: DegV family protein [Candidatus Izemoplasmatales bacterium]|jgi:DegV family protein with EDD domain|nr:DegV family protein [Candidatus Izemoplasmatales bacterium]MDD3865338.1 DegV family protein [Candidatus Izemoplasmatales bacterium]